MSRQLSLFDYASVVLVGLLLILTVAGQFRNQSKWVARWKYRDVCGIIPLWTFFAPNPGMTDYHLMWRDRYADHSCSPWHEVVAPSASWLKAIWNPHKRSRKA